jgi:hypothetical protein
MARLIKNQNFKFRDNLIPALVRVRGAKKSKVLLRDKKQGFVAR